MISCISVGALALGPGLVSVATAGSAGAVATLATYLLRLQATMMPSVHYLASAGTLVRYFTQYISPHAHSVAGGTRTSWPALPAPRIRVYWPLSRKCYRLRRRSPLVCPAMPYGTLQAPVDSEGTI